MVFIEARLVSDMEVLLRIIARHLAELKAETWIDLYSDGPMSDSRAAKLFNEMKVERLQNSSPPRMASKALWMPKRLNRADPLMAVPLNLEDPHAVNAFALLANRTINTEAIVGGRYVFSSSGSNPWIEIKLPRDTVVSMLAEARDNGASGFTIEPPHS